MPICRAIAGGTHAWYSEKPEGPFFIGFLALDMQKESASLSPRYFVSAARVARAAFRIDFAAFAAATSATVRRCRLCGAGGLVKAAILKRGYFSIAADIVLTHRSP
jgi:hypothetical protein